MTEVEQALQFIDSILAKVAVPRVDHAKIVTAIDLISDAIFEKLGDKK